jgi:hypothetical protein
LAPFQRKQIKEDFAKLTNFKLERGADDKKTRGMVTKFLDFFEKDGVLFSEILKQWYPFLGVRLG